MSTKFVVVRGKRSRVRLPIKNVRLMKDGIFVVYLEANFGRCDELPIIYPHTSLEAFPEIYATTLYGVIIHARGLNPDEY